MEDSKIIEARESILEKFQVKDQDLFFIEKLENKGLVTYVFNADKKRKSHSWVKR